MPATALHIRVNMRIGKEQSVLIAMLMFMAILTGLSHYLMILYADIDIINNNFHFINLLYEQFLHGERPETPSQFRLIIPLLYVLFKYISFGNVKIAVLLMECTIALFTYFLFWFFLKSYLNFCEKLIALFFLNGLIFVSLTNTLLIGETINLALFTLCVTSIERKRPFLIVLFSTVLLALQRLDLASFASIIYLCGWKWDGHLWMERVMKALILLCTVCALGFTIKLAFGIGDNLALNFFHQTHEEKTPLFLHNIKHGSWLFLIYFNVLWILALTHFRQKPAFLRRGLVLMIPYLLVLLVVGNFLELRLFLPFALFLIPLSILTLRPILTKMILADQSPVHMPCD